MVRGGKSTLAGNADTWGVDQVCPYNYCGTLRFYVHKHDLACNFIGPASPTGAAISPNPFQASEVTVMPSDGALGSASIQIALHKVPKIPWANEFGFTSSEITGQVASNSNFNGLKFAGGMPTHIGAAVLGGVTQVGSAFGVEVDVLDQYDNITGFETGYGVDRTATFSWDAHNAPNNTPPILGGPTYTIGYQSLTPGLVQTPFDFTLQRANEVVTLHISATDNAAISYCIPGSCPSTPKTFTTNLTILPTGGTPTSFVILNAASASGTAIPAGTNLTSGTTMDLFACVKDALGNITDCNLSTTWTDTNDTGHSYKITGSTFGTTSDVALSLTGNSPASANGASATGVKATITGNKVGTGQITASITSPIVASAVTPAITVVPNSVTGFRVVGLPLSSTLCTGQPCDTRVTAGQQFSVAVVALDAIGNIASGFVGSKSVVVLANNAPQNHGGFQGIPAFPGGAQNLTFAGGVANFDATAYTAGNYNFGFTVTYSGDAGTVGAIQSFSKEPIDIDPAPLAQYALTGSLDMGTPANHVAPAKSTPDNTYANVGGSRFDILISGIDLYGNGVDCSGAASRTATLTLMQADKVTPVGRDLICSNNSPSCLSNIQVAYEAQSGQKCAARITKLAYDVGGDYFLRVTDGTYDTFSLSEGSFFRFTTSKDTIKNFAVIPSTLTPTAGVAFNVQVQALDNSGQQISGADPDFSALQFDFTDGTGTAIPNSNKGDLPILPSTFTWGSGAAFPSLKLFAAQTLKLKVTDRTVHKTGTSAQDVVVGAGTNLLYTVTVKHNDGTAIANGAHIPADPSPAGRLKVDIVASDTYGNSRAGEPGIVLAATKTGGPLYSGILQKAVSGSYASGWGGMYAPLGPNNGNYGQTCGATPCGPFVDLSSAQLTISDVFYGVAQPVYFTLTGTAATVTSVPTVINFDTTLGTVAQLYGAQITGQSAPSIRAGVPFSTAITALDANGNLIDNIDNLLNQQTYTWTGPHAGLPPLNHAFTATNIAGQFNGGIAPVTLTFYKAEVIPLGTFQVADDFGTTHSSYSGNRVGANFAAVPIINGLADHYVFTPTTSQPTVGSPFGGLLAVFDADENPATDWTSDNLTWSWSGATSSPITPKMAAHHDPAVTAGGATTFAGGQVAIPSDFLLYNAVETPTLTVTGTNNVTKSGSVLSKSVQLTPKPLASVGYVYVTNGTSCNGSGDCGAGSTRTTGNFNSLVDDTLLFYAHGFDDYGNYKGPAAGNWTNTGLTANFTPGLTGSSSLAVALTAATPNGSPGQLSYSCINLATGCIGDTTGTISVTPGQLHYNVTYATTGIKAGQAFTVTVKTQDTHNNDVTSYSGNQTVSINGTNVFVSNEGDLATYPSGQQTLKEGLA